MGRGWLVATAAVGVAACGGAREQPPAEVRTVTVEIGDPSQQGDRQGPAKPAADRRTPADVPGDEQCAGAGDATTAENVREAEIAIRCLTNAVRSKHDLEELRFDERLARAAATRSNDMAEQRYFAHEGPDGGDVQRAVRRTGWIPEKRSWLLGENIGWAPEGRATPVDLMRSWLDSPTHRANILNEHYTELGVGAVAAVPKADAKPGATYTQVFGVTGRAARIAQAG